MTTPTPALMAALHPRGTYRPPAPTPATAPRPQRTHPPRAIPARPPWIRKWIWTTESTHTPGAKIKSGGQMIFIRREDLYAAADALVEIAESYDGRTYLTETRS